MSQSQANKIILVTGASSGLGKDAALFLASRGAKAIALMARRQDRLEQVEEKIKGKYPSVQTLVIVGDASKEADNEQAVQKVVEKFGGLTGAFLNAGIYRAAPLTQTDELVVDEILSTNVKGVVFGLKHVLSAIAKTVGDTGPTGSVVVTSSCMGSVVIGPKSAGSAIYSASKAFVNSLVETAAIECAPRVRVNAVSPGVVRTEVIPVDDETYQKFGAALQPLYKRPGQPREIFGLVSFLLSDEASFISGTNVKADGLWSLSGGGMPEM